MSREISYHVPAGTVLKSCGKVHTIFPVQGGYRAENMSSGVQEFWTVAEYIERSRRGDATRSYVSAPGSIAAARIRRGGLFHRDQLDEKGRIDLDFKKAIVAGVEALATEGVKITGPALDKRENRSKILQVASPLYQHGPIWLAQRGGANRQGAVMPKGRTIREYREKFIEAGYDEMALADQIWLKGNRTQRLHWRVLELIDQAIEEEHLDLKNPMVSVAHKRQSTLVELENEMREMRQQPPLRPASHNAVSKHIKKINATTLSIARDGERFATNARPRGSTDTQSLMLGELLEIDECKLSVLTSVRKSGFWEALSTEDKEALEELDAEVRERLWLVLIIDVATRMPLAWVLSDSPRSDATMEALRMATRCKQREKVIYGCDCDPAPAVGIGALKNDNGSGLRNSIVKTGLLGIGAMVIDARAYHSGDTPFVERMWHTMESQLFNLLHGYCGRKAGHLKGYDAKANGVIFREELYRLITRYLVDEYPFQTHYGETMYGRSPAHAMAQLTDEGWAIDVPSPHDRRLHLGWRQEAIITDEGVKIFGLRYNSAELQKFRDGPNRKVAVYCDPDCTNNITVVVKGHPEYIHADLTWTAMSDMSFPEVLAHFEELRKNDPANTGDTRRRLAKLRQERFEELRHMAVERGLKRSYMTLAEVEKKAAVLTTGLQEAYPKATGGTVAPGSLADLEKHPHMHRLGAGFQPPIEAKTIQKEDEEFGAFLGRPDQKGRFK